MMELKLQRDCNGLHGRLTAPTLEWMNVLNSRTNAFVEHHHEHVTHYVEPNAFGDIMDRRAAAYLGY